MKLYKTTVILLFVPLILYAVIGNIYVFLFTYNELKGDIRTKYGGKLDIVGYGYDARNKDYTFYVRDDDGVDADFSYSGKENTFSDGYAYVSSRVSYYAVRGRIMKKIISSGVIPEDADVIYKSKVKTVNETATEVITPDEVIVTIADGGDKNKFCTDAETLIRSLISEKIAKISVYSENFSLSVTDGMISSDRKDILAAIRSNTG